MQPPPEPVGPRSRHSVEVPGYGQPAPAMSTPPPPQPARHRGEQAEAEAEAEPDEGPSGQHAGGQSVADLLARLQANGTGGGRRRRRED